MATRAYIQFLRIDGVNLTDRLIDQREIGGTVADQLRQADEIMRINIRRAANVGGAVREEFQTILKKRCGN